MATDSHAAHDHPHGWRRYVYSTNHKDIGTMYLIFAIIAGIVGGALSIGMRMELQEPGMQIFSDPNVYNMFTTAHALIMIFFMVMPALIGGFGNWFVPIMIGAPDMAFPRMNNISFWLLAAGAHPAAAVDVPRWWPAAPTASPVAGRSIRRSTSIVGFASGRGGRSRDPVSLHIAGASSILGAINFITTIFNMRAPGMTLHKHAAVRLGRADHRLPAAVCRCRCSRARSPCC